MNRQLSLLAAVIVVALLACEQQFAFAQGIFSTASTAGGDQDANVGLDATKSYFNAINVNGATSRRQHGHCYWDDHHQWHRHAAWHWERGGQRTHRI